MKDSRQLFNKYKSGKDFIKAAEKSENVVSIRQGKGDHVIVTAKNGKSIPVPMHREIATGTRWNLIKFFVKAGIIVFVLAYIFLKLNYLI